MIDLKFDAISEIEDIIDEFDFEEVHKVMEFLDWTWFDAGDANGGSVPRIAELRKKARKLLNEAADSVLRNNELPAESCIATGGFRATAHRYGDTDKIYFRLSFELSEWDNYD